MTVLCHAHIVVVADVWNPHPIVPVGSLPLTQMTERVFLAGSLPRSFSPEPI